MNYQRPNNQQDSLESILHGAYGNVPGYLTNPPPPPPVPVMPTNKASPAQARADAVGPLEPRKKPGVKNGAKKRSWVWDWFVQDHADANAAVCDHCQKTILRLALDKGLPKKLSEHLKTHKISRESINPTREGHVPQGNDSARVLHPSMEESMHATALLAYAPGAPPTRAPEARYYSQEFDNGEYTQMKFQKNIMRFLTENKLPIAVVKSHSFRQIIYDMRPNSIPELNELNSLYSSLIQVLKNDKDEPESEAAGGSMFAQGEAPANGASWEILR
ncbi:hypothetical protein BABINDRAFT_164198 [Babjeviella inositovora NRRL Y-12698]|uniref:BED-type domain-containing protein n=1 Tax=Babjeviella inositovora NRRL Y-12698 TaxID=984486 RepID=A0A1E3QZ81_9ASCO|nr:uncharacterized protein BABINDRAFT_164198 [Babjeviella inositovora NRRL Y-12698]ODQ82397.1 hypothetical protein BABINDRAFT_164198 [Babjeviella inositovora NRRL Y-12698]